MKRIIWVLIVLSASGCSSPKKQAAVVQALPVIQVRAGEATVYQDYPAAVEGVDNVEIRPQVSGILEQIAVDEGSFVHAGQLLFKINQAPFVEKLNDAVATLHAAQGALSNAELEIEKLTPLVANKVVADYQLRTAQSSRDIAQANVDQAKAHIAAAKIDLGYSLIKAPVNGYIGRLLRKKGSLVAPNDPSALTELSDVHDVHVYFSLGEYDFIQFKSQFAGRTLTDKIKKMPPIDLVLADESTFPARGKIDLVDGEFDQNTGAITVRASFPNNDGILRSGNTGKVRLGLKSGNQIIIPQAATQEMQDKVFVFLVGQGNKVTKQLITISSKVNSTYLVKDGLKPGDKIVLKGYDHLKDGDIIQPENVQNNLVANN